MKKPAAALLICLLSQSHALADEPPMRDLERPSVRVLPLGAPTVMHAIRVEALRLASSVTAADSPVQSVQASTDPDTRNWCRRHPVGCGAVLGLTGGFVVGLTYQQGGDPCCTRVGFGLILGGYGAGVGAAAGAAISAATK